MHQWRLLIGAARLRDTPFGPAATLDAVLASPNALATIAMPTERKVMEPDYFAHWVEHYKKFIIRMNG